GLGITSIGKVGDAYAQNTKTLREYYHRMHRHQLAIERGLTLTSDDRIRRDVIQRLMCQGIVDLAELGREHCIDAYEYFAVELARLRSLERDGLVVVGPTKIEVTPRGRLLVRNIAAVFDVYLPMHEPAAFSKAI